MQRKLLLAMVLSAMLAAALVLGSRPFSSGQEPIPAPPPALLPPSLASPALPPSSPPAGPQSGGYLGVGSCASPACHGGPDSAENNRQRGKWNSAYTVWVEKDRHAKAYSVLYGEKSKKILRNLDHLDSVADPKPYPDDRCLACHATVSATPPDGRAFLADGVGCEACHGAARGWIVEHTIRTWDKADARNYRDPHAPAANGDFKRMVNTPDLAVRAGVCADCHIGSPAADGRPARNMDHDMIAAGHPRLTFEMSAFLANMPHHWEDRAETGRDGKGRDEKGREEYAARVWAVGQIASTQAALRLLAGRAKAAEADPQTAPWPELSGYDCYTCHHGLALDSYRQKIKRAGEPRKLGRYVWGTWYLPMAQLLIEQSPAASPGLAGVDRVANLLDDPAPKASAVRAAADSAAREMQTYLDAAKKAPYDRPVMDRLLLATRDRPAKNWDEACGQYLLFRNVLAQDPRFADSLAAVREHLQFRDKKLDYGPLIRYNSPLDFDPGKFNEKMDALRSLVQQTPDRGEH